MKVRLFKIQQNLQHRILREGAIIGLLFLSGSVLAQQNVVTLEWTENEGIQTSYFGAPAAVDANDNFYRAGFVVNDQGGTDAVLQKRDEGGNLDWQLTLNTASADKYEPVELFIEGTEGTDIFITGVVKNTSNGETDIWVARADNSGNLAWFDIEVEPGMDYSADIIYEANSEQIYICGTTDRNKDYDLLLMAYSLNGDQEWLSTKDYNGHA